MSSDENLQKSVESELRWDPMLKAAHIGVSADDGVVTLTGHVESFAEKHEAEAAARRVKGVTGVAQEIEVRLAPHAARADDEIAKRAVMRLQDDVSVPADAIKVQVEKGWLTLTGEVDWQFQRDAAAHAVARLPGIIDIANRITIRPRVDVAVLADDITHALHRSWFFDPQTMRVSATGGTVTLTGYVKSPHERQLAAATAWSAPGVTDVVNELSIGDPED